MNSDNTTDPVDSFSQAQFLEFINCTDESILQECVHYIISSIEICDLNFIHEIIIPSITKLLSRSTPINIVQYLISIIPDICDVFFERFPDEAQNLLLNSVLPIIHAIALNSKNGCNINRATLLAKSSSNSNLRKNLPQKSNQSSSNQKTNNGRSMFSSTSNFNYFDLNPQIVDVLSETWASLVTLLDFNNFIVIEIPYIRMISSSPKRESRIVVLKVLSFLVGYYDPETWFMPLFQIINQMATDNSGQVRALLPPLIVQLAQKLPTSNKFGDESQFNCQDCISENQTDESNDNQNENNQSQDDAKNDTQNQNETRNDITNQTSQDQKEENIDETNHTQDQTQTKQNEPTKITHQSSQRNPSFELARFCAIYTIFSRDSNTLVRKACAESLVTLCDTLDYSNRLVTILPITELLLTDQSELVRNVMLRNLGPLISSLGSKLSNSLLVQKYCTTLVSKDISISYPAAFAFPAVTIALGYERFNELKTSFNTALNSKEFKVRRTLSFGLLSFAHILSKSELFEVVMNFLNDISSVAIGVMNNLNVIATMLDKNDRIQLINSLKNPSEKYDQWRMRLKVSEQLRYCSELFTSLSDDDDEEETTKNENKNETQTENQNQNEINTKNQAEKQKENQNESNIINQTENQNQTTNQTENNNSTQNDSQTTNKDETKTSKEQINQIQSEKSKDNKIDYKSIAKENLEILKQSAKELLYDKVAVVRKDAVLSYSYLMEKDNKSDQQFILDMAKSDKYFEREIAATIFEFEDLDKISGIIHILLQILINDKVPNVRISVANAVMSIASVLPESNENFDLICEAKEKLKNDKDLDVRSAILN